MARERAGTSEYRGRLTRPRKPFTIDLLEQGHEYDGHGYDGEYKTTTERLLPSNLYLLDLAIAYAVQPDFVTRRYVPPLDVSLPGDNLQMTALKKLGEKEFFRQVRRLLKKEWRKQLKRDWNMSYDTYESRLVGIHQIGRDPDSVDNITRGDYYTSQLREDVFQRGVEGVDEFAVLKWGPLELLDSGSVNVNANVITDAFSGDIETDSLEVAPESSHPPLLSGENYRLHTRFRLHVDPFRMIRENDPMAMVRSYGATVETTWLTDILKRERFITEAEIQYRPNRDEVSVFFNFVLNIR